MSVHTPVRSAPRQDYRARYGVVFKAGGLVLAGITVNELLRNGATMLIEGQWVWFLCFLVASIVGVLMILQAFLDASTFGTQGFRHRTMFGRTISGSYSDIVRISYQPQRLILFLKSGHAVKVFAQPGDLDKILDIIRESHPSIPVDKP